ncbi:hypothetical protein ACFQVA_16545 [Actinomadura keratinilytica]
MPSSTRLLADRLGEAVARDLGAAEVPVRVEAVELRDLANDIAQNFTAASPARSSPPPSTRSPGPTRSSPSRRSSPPPTAVCSSPSSTCSTRRP